MRNESRQMSPQAKTCIQLTASQAGNRLDKVLAGMFPEYSRSCLQGWLKNGHIRLDGETVSARHKVRGREVVEMAIPAQPEQSEVQPQALELVVIYEDQELIVINKPAGMVVHPAAGNLDGTLQNALLYRYPDLAGVPRSGIVHRLDKDTSGLMVVARSLQAHKNLVEQLQQRTVSREYLAIVQGTLVAGGTIEEPIGRHPQDRKRMCVRAGGRQAITHYRVSERYRHHSCLSVKLETGRTHQIRVHMAYIKKPIIGDPVYGGRLRIPGNTSEMLQQCLREFKRQALHAARLGLLHPETGDNLEWQVDCPDDMQKLIKVLQQDIAGHDHNTK